MTISKILRKKSEVVVKIKNGSKGVGQVIIRDADKEINLGGDTYHKYRIVRPRGHEQEEIFHRQDRGYEALLSEVFMILDSCQRGQARTRDK